MERKTYYANVEVNVVDYFEKTLGEQKEHIEVVRKSGPVIFGDGVECIQYILKADDGYIDPKWELK